MKLVVFNVKFSENLGDGLLAACMETALSEQSDIEVETIDLAGRREFGITSRNRRRFIRILHALPPFVRRLAVHLALRSKLAELRQEWDRKLATADAVVLGGGNLLQDDDLNFPLKVGTLADCVRRRGIPLAVYAVGVSGHWSAQAHSLFSRIDQAGLVHMSVRDETARANWIRHFPEGPVPIVLPDPGLLTGRSFPPDAQGRQYDAADVIGVCVTDPIILVHHADKNGAEIGLRTVDDYSELVRLLVRQGHRVRLFSNGAREDQAFAEQIFTSSELAPLKGTEQLELADRPTLPEQLVEIIGSTSGIIAHRLHACIAAYAMAIPHVGLGWDSKVESFFRSVAREAFFAKGELATPNRLAALIDAALRQGIDRTEHESRIAATFAGVAAMKAALLERSGNVRFGEMSQTDADQAKHSLQPAWLEPPFALES